MTDIQVTSKWIDGKVFIHKVCLSKNKGNQMLIRAVCVDVWSVFIAVLIWWNVPNASQSLINALKQILAHTSPVFKP